KPGPHPGAGAASSAPAAGRIDPVRRARPAAGAAGHRAAAGSGCHRPEDRIRAQSGHRRGDDPDGAAMSAADAQPLALPPMIGAPAPRSGRLGTLLYGRNVNRSAKARARVGLAILAFALVYGIIAARLVMFAVAPESHFTRRGASKDAVATARPDILD